MLSHSLFAIDAPLSVCCHDMRPAPTPRCYGIQPEGSVLLLNSSNQKLKLVFENGERIEMDHRAFVSIQSNAFAQTYLNGNIDGGYILFDKNDQQIAHGYINLINGRINPVPANTSSWCKEDDTSKIWCNNNGYQGVCMYDAAGRFIAARTNITFLPPQTN